MAALVSFDIVATPTCVLKAHILLNHEGLTLVTEFHSESDSAHLASVIANRQSKVCAPVCDHENYSLSGAI